jgi:hypothetical protein
MSTSVELWGGWSLILPSPCSQTRNPDGSWSAWDGFHTVDVHIMEMGGDSGGEPLAPEQILARPATSAGHDWIGTSELIEDADEKGPVFRFAIRAAATNTLISCWVAYRSRSDLIWAKAIEASLRHER